MDLVMRPATKDALSLLNSLQTPLFEAVTHLQETNNDERISSSKLTALFKGLGRAASEDELATLFVSIGRQS
jgi:hypothetical protein